MEMVSSEEVLAEQLQEEVQKWLKEERNFSPRLAIKFCGGCNPYYDRAEVARLIKRNLKEEQWVGADKEADLLFIINGCSASCAERAEVEEKAKRCISVRGNTISAIYTPRTK